jgi:hypothetical protein
MSAHREVPMSLDTQCRFRGPVRLRPCFRRAAGSIIGPPLAQLRRAEGDSAVIREELSRLFTIGERHRRLFARLVIAFGLSIVVFAVCTVLIWVFESGQKGGNIHGFGDAAFFCAVQLLTVSSSMTNPVTSVGKIIDVGLEAWAIFVVTAVAGSFATFFSSGDASLSASPRSCRWPGTTMPPCPLRARSAGQRRELAVTPGQPDTPAHLRTGRLSRCVNRPSK